VLTRNRPPSLLLGVDQQRKEIVCGLVDTIGSYTFAKTLEYKAKQGSLATRARK
jgi:1-phosphatidylinositol-3-phosphate 5-kinase